ncbi:MAG TPA: PEP-CTERM sorting domain-containing protein [Fimbriimonadaceae bacterium]|nr:PEP-CTERM sorting domain-containing protein [Fimbriimonadaceae bacterium]
MNYSKLIVFSLAACAASSSFAFSVTPGTVVGFDVNTSSLVEYDFSGSINETLVVTGLPNTNVGVAILGNRVFVGDVAGNVGEVNLGTGAVSGLFSTGLNEALGDNGRELLALNYNSGTVQRFTPGGSLVGSSGTNVGNTGVDGTPNTMYTANYNDGRIYRWDYAGNNLGSFATGLANGSLSGLGYDPVSGFTWVSAGFGDDSIRAYDAAGNQVINFASNKGWINGLDVVPVPEPATMAVFALGLLALRRRKK